MRFHCGISFSWRTIKKFLIPFLLGLFAVLGFNFINDNKPINVTPFLLKTYALENDYEDINENDIPDEIEDNYNYWREVYSISDNEVSEVEHKPIHDKVYWFDDNTTELGVLSSIYILLFLYCFSMIILKLITIVKNVRW